MNTYFSYDEDLIPAHGGQGLRPLLAEEKERAGLLAKAEDLPGVEISSRARGDLIMLGLGGFTPLSGFMTREDWKSVCANMTLSDGTFWPLPVVLDVDDSAAGLAGKEIALVHNGKTVALMRVEQAWRMDADDAWFECEAIFKGQGPDSENFPVTGPERHPGVKHVLARKQTYLAGPVTVLEDDPHPDLPAGFMLAPAELRAKAAANGWKDIVCLQLRNPPHRSHEYLARIGLETSDALLVHTPMGALKPGDLPTDVRLAAIRALVDNYLPAERVILAGYPLDMRYAGPREALLHAVFRQNYGISTQIVGRDHAGVADFYAPFEAQEIFSRIPHNPDPGKRLLTRALKIKWPFYCRKCDSMASLNTCPHTQADRVFHSGSLLRKSFTENTIPPEGFIRREVFDVLAKHYREVTTKEEIILYGAADGKSLKPRV